MSDDAPLFEEDPDASFARDVERAPLEPEDAIDRVVEVSAMLSVFAAEQVWAISEMRADAHAEAKRAGRNDRGIVERSLRLELAQAIGATEAAADRLISHAVALVERYPETLTALSRAQITQRHAEALVDAVDRAEPWLREELAPLALELAMRLPIGVFRHAVRRLVDDARAATLSERQREALDTRRVAVDDDRDGMAWLTVYLPAVEARAIFDRLTRTAAALIAAEPAASEAAESSVGDEANPRRTLDQARADVAADLLIDGQVPQHGEQARGIRATVAVTVPALTLLGASEVPAVVDGVGPIPLAKARELCGAADGWMRVLTHPETGLVLSVGRTQYRPPASLRRLARWRSARCSAPGCMVPANRCEIDHTIAWEHGGSTTADNLTPLCKGHHTVKHHGGWKVRQFADASTEWTSPTGRIYTVVPERRTPAFVPDASPPGDPPF
ncbi:hypothetical protein QE374_002471 [Microbacterium sp. SORGH_AS428]|uniref:HNH endonuclease signature motif containing protein n=1 Tax=Microbacterium sp. SORGH_AS_0428 TaxID=3041788 RepID=UPI00285DB2B0|nr:DUF222 domain-containing protein [Microbacterium sp. SORGH_AS_0428]MDR6200562.1 hypothetical protein [Microbacterium sp. SORGH_AS_0428]